MIAGILLVLGAVAIVAGGILAHVTTEAPPGRPLKSPMSRAAFVAWNVAALVLIVVGFLSATGGAVLLAMEVAL